MNGSIGLSSFSSSPLGSHASCAGETCCCTWMTVAASSGGNGDLESMRLKRFVELFRRMRMGLLTTLRSLALSAVSDMLDGLLPISI